MTTHGPDPVTPAEARARDAVRGLEPPRADAAFRERLKRDFVTGRIGERRVLELPIAWHRRRAWRLALAPVAVAALAVAVVVANRGPRWEVLETEGTGIVIVDQTAVPLAHADQLQRRLRPGARVRVPEGSELELAAAGSMVVQITAGTEFTLPASPGRWFARGVAGAVRGGVIRVTTGPAFHGARLRVDTPEATVDVTGTTLAVICEPVGTCVCVYDGVVRVGARGGTAEAVASGHRRFVFNDGRAPELAEIRPAEIGNLGSFRESHRSWLEGGAK
jgi:ferric-dicitrate binding protein FerR (iron transport regulator)